MTSLKDCAVSYAGQVQKGRRDGTSATATSRKHTNEGNADFAVEHQTPLTTPTEQISPANQQHKSNDFFTRELRWCSAFESSAIGITVADLDGPYLAANTVFQNTGDYAGPELQEFFFWDITYEEDREIKFKLVRELVEGRGKHFQIEKRSRRNDGALLWHATIFLSFRDRGLRE
jgi:PAS domain S-box-containing protein